LNSSYYTNYIAEIIIKKINENKENQLSD